MARLTYRFKSMADVPAVALSSPPIPGLKFDRVNPIVIGHADVMDVLGIDPKKVWPQSFPELEIRTFSHPQLRSYQYYAYSWIQDVLLTHHGAILADDMGLGKTRTAIYTATQLPGNNTTLVICPANVLYQWQEECSVFNITGHVLGPPSNKRFDKAWDTLKGGLQSFYITSYQLAQKVLDAAPFVPTMCILDEPHMFFRGRTNKIAWAVQEYAQQMKYRLACTGTPMFNQPRDLWFILFILLGMRFGKAKEFDARYCDGKQGTYGWENKGATNLPELRKRLSHYMLRRTTEDVQLELPPLTTSFRWAEPTPQAIAAMMKVTSGGPAVDEALRACLDAKVDLAVTTAIELEPCIVFTYHRHHAEEIAAKIEKDGGKAVALHGGITSQVRHNLIKHCAASRTSIVCTIDSMGTGTNLQGVTSNMVFHTIERSPKKTHQAIKRTHRSGQDKPGQAVFLAMKDAMDEIVSETVIKRLETWEQLMGRDTMNEDIGDALITTQETEDEILKSIYAAMR